MAGKLGRAVMDGRAALRLGRGFRAQACPAVLIAALLLSWTAIAEEKKPGAESLDTEHIFGFTEGTDIGEKGEAEIESATVLRFGRTAGYSAAGNDTAYRYVIADHFRISLSSLTDYHSIEDVPGLQDRNAFGFAGLASEMRWQFLDHDKDPIGMTLSLTPQWRRIGELSGAIVESYASQAAVLIDRVLIPNKAFAALNLTYAPGVTRTIAGWQHDSSLEISAAAAYAVTPEVFLGAEIRHLSGDSLIEQGLFAAHGLYIGPSAYVKFSSTESLKFAWSVQIPDETTGRLDLRDFEHHQLLVQFIKSF